MRRKKQWMSVLLSLCIGFGAIPNAVLAEETLYAAEQSAPASFIASGDYDITTLKDGTVRIVKYIGSDTDVSIPSEIDGKTVTTIGEGAFLDQTRVESVTIPDTVTTIENGAFVNCVSLTAFTMADSVTAMGEYVFGRCMSLQDIRLSNSLKTIPTNTFYSCTALRTVTIPEGVTTLGDAVFAFCELDDLVLPDTVESIGEGILFGTSVKSLYLPVTVLNGNSLQCKDIGTLEFSDKLTRIEADGLAHCTISELHLPKNLSYIDLQAFTDCKYEKLILDEANPYLSSENSILYSKDKTILYKYPNIGYVTEKNIQVPDTVTTIADYAFNSVMFDMASENPEDNVLVIDLPDSVKSIGEHAFEVCFITQISIPESIEMLAPSLFHNAFLLQTVELKEGIKTISKDTFAGAGALKSLTIPASVTYIDTAAFRECTGLQNIVISEENKNYSIKDGCIYDAAGETLLIYLPSEGVEEYGGTFSIPEGTKAIGEKAFCGCSLAEVIIPSSLTTIGEKAFYQCESLKTLQVPSSVTNLSEKCFGYADLGLGDKTRKILDTKIIADETSAAAKYAMENEIAFFTEEHAVPSEIIEMHTGDEILLDQTGILPGSVQYTSGNENIAYCDLSGNVKAIAPGYTSIVMSSGTTNVIYEINVSGEPVDDGHISIEIETGKEYDFDPSEYAIYETEEEFEAYLEDYLQFNNEVSYDPLDNACIICYSGNDYVPLLASRGDPYRVNQIIDNPSHKHLELFTMISDHLYEELSEFKASQNAVLYRGIKSAAELTGTGNTVADMKKSIGSIYVPRTNLSTTLSHRTATGFAGSDDGGAVLEIYAPKELLNGSYIEGITANKGEQEYLVDEGSRFLILDAGVRAFRLEEDWPLTCEKYFKLLLLQNDITKVNVNLIEPIPGEELSGTADVYGVGLASDKVDAVWTVEEEPADTKADYDTTYSAKLKLTPSAGFAFTEQSSIYVNGNKYEYELGEDGSALVAYTYVTPGADAATN